MDLQFEWVETWEDVCSPLFVEQWKRWVETADNSHVFSHPELALAWIATYRSLWNMSPRFLIARSEGMEVFFPLVVWTRNAKHLWQRLLVPVGYADFDYCEPLLVGGLQNNSWAEIWRMLKAEIIRHLGNEVDQVDIPGIRQEIGDRDSATLGESCAYLDLNGIPEGGDILELLKRSHRQPLERRLRRLQEMGGVTLHVYEESEQKELARGLGSFLQHHRRRWPNAYKAPNLHDRLVNAAMRAGLLHFAELRLVTGQAICWQIGFIWRGTYYAYQFVYDPEFAKLSPGQVCLLFCIRDSCKRGLKTFDHLRGEEAYKSGWASGQVRLLNIRICGSRSFLRLRSWLANKVQLMAGSVTRSRRRVVTEQPDEQKIDPA